LLNPLQKLPYLTITCTTTFTFFGGDGGGGGLDIPFGIGD